MAHTPGPWKVGPEKNWVCSESVPDNIDPTRTSGWGGYNQGFVCDLDDGEYHKYGNKQEMLDNACLIAAAPDLLEAAKDVLALLKLIHRSSAHWDEPLRQKIRQLKTAIEKAENKI